MTRREDRNYYQILGVREDSSADEIKRAYRALAFEYHPDRNPDAREWAEERFKTITEAYGVLMDTRKRQDYDRVRRQGSGRADGQGSGFGASRQDIFRDLFGNEFASRVFEDLERDFRKHGIRFDPAFFEHLFSGRRGIFFAGAFFFGPMGRSMGRQSVQQGRSRVDLTRSAYDTLRKTRTKQEPLLARVGKGLARLTGLELPKGHEQAFGKESGDLYYHLAISPEEAERGTELPIAVPRGKKQDKLLVKVPAGTVSGTTLRLRGKGRALQGRKRDRGHLYITLRVRAASSNPDTERDEGD
jgi:DnaJ-class molecular chaperone